MTLHLPIFVWKHVFKHMSGYTFQTTVVCCLLCFFGLMFLIAFHLVFLFNFFLLLPPTVAFGQKGTSWCLLRRKIHVIFLCNLASTFCLSSFCRQSSGGKRLRPPNYFSFFFAFWHLTLGLHDCLADNCMWNLLMFFVYWILLLDFFSIILQNGKIFISLVCYFIWKWESSLRTLLCVSLFISFGGFTARC